MLPAQLTCPRQRIVSSQTMTIPRIIPVLLLQEAGLVKTVKFRAPNYVGDPINAIRIFNEKEADELILLDILATKQGRDPSFERIRDIAAECYMPFCYGGGVRSLAAMEKIYNIGAEKVSLNTACVEIPGLISNAVRQFGSQSVVASIDVKKNIFGRYRVYTRGGGSLLREDPVEYARVLEGEGVGEVIVNSIDRDGMMGGYDIELLCRISSALSIPVIAAGGAGSLADFRRAIVEGGASACAAGSMFVYHGKHKAVLVTYPDRRTIVRAFTVL